ncbi:prolyl-tRNA synthetase associated domain-containing protein 1-like [Sebastes fasciatus]|uniref:prolyl-tRNA synthetase associated domain-containing protein 1-like n=1 Tax=Sebastes fasciatus TaxID=394691 RepID=UPI003D9F9B36
MNTFQMKAEPRFVKSLWPVSARHDRQVNLNDLAKKLGVGGGNLRFVDEAAMLEKLKVDQGCATALALLFDKDQIVKFVLDRDLVEGGHEMVYFHPMINTTTMGRRPDDLLCFLKETGQEPVLESLILANVLLPSGSHFQSKMAEAGR